MRKFLGTCFLLTFCFANISEIVFYFNNFENLSVDASFGLAVLIIITFFFLIGAFYMVEQ